MATIRKEILIAARPEQAWDAVRDVGAVHTRLAPGFVTDTKMDGDARIVTFANGLVAREAIVSIDEESRRLAYSATGPRLAHHNASIQIFAADGDGTRMVWTADLLPDAMAPAIDGMMVEGAKAMQAALGRG